jgi:hypothetical protein
MPSGFRSENLREKKRLGRSRSRWDSDSTVDVKSSRMRSRGLDSHGSGLRQLKGCYEYGNEKQVP